MSVAISPSSIWYAFRVDSCVTLVVLDIPLILLCMALYIITDAGMSVLPDM